MNLASLVLPTLFTRPHKILRAVIGTAKGAGS